MITAFFESFAYAFVDGALRKVELISQELTHELDGNGELENDIEIIAKYKDEHIRLTPGDLYSGKDAYIANVNLNPTRVSHCNLDLTDEWTYFVLENGKIVEKNFIWDKIFMTKDENDCWKCTSPSLPKEYYDSREVCAAMCTFKYEDENGNEKTYKGIMHNVMLSDEQKNLVKAVEDAWKKAEQAGVRFTYDFDNGELLAFNSDGGKNIVEYYEDVDREKYKGIPGRALRNLIVNVNAICKGCDYAIYVEKSE